MPSISIIIPVFNRASLTHQCLNILLKKMPVGSDCEILVVDDASTDSTAELLASYGGQVRVVTHEANAGFAASCNDGAALATGNYLVFLNNDTIPQDGWLAALNGYLERHPRVGVAGSKLLFPNNTIQHAGIAISQDRVPMHVYIGFPAEHPAVNKSRRFRAVTGACMMVRRALFEQAGGFDTAFRNSYEDVDLCMRLEESGYETHYCHESVLYHLEGVSEGRFQKEELNSQLFTARWGSKLEPDDFKYYFEDKLVQVHYRPQCPFALSLSPDLVQVDGARAEEADRLLAERSRQVYDLVKENVQLSLFLLESGRRPPLFTAYDPSAQDNPKPTPLQGVDYTRLTEQITLLWQTIQELELAPPRWIDPKTARWRTLLYHTIKEFPLSYYRQQVGAKARQLLGLVRR